MKFVPLEEQVQTLMAQAKYWEDQCWRMKARLELVGFWFLLALAAIGVIIYHLNHLPKECLL